MILNGEEVEQAEKSKEKEDYGRNAEKMESCLKKVKAAHLWKFFNSWRLYRDLVNAKQFIVGDKFSNRTDWADLNFKLPKKEKKAKIEKKPKKENDLKLKKKKTSLENSANLRQLERQEEGRAKKKVNNIFSLLSEN